jgi:glycosyltransferase involved in cell wall biosynthesis
MKTQKISVLIPTYKSVDHLDLCLRSCIEGCNFSREIEIIVGVDGTYDICKPVLDKWKDYINFISLEINGGLCRILNLLVYNASSDRILIVNDDNVFSKHWDVLLMDDWEEGTVISPNQMEPYPSIFKQFYINNMGTDPTTFDLEKFWLYDYHYLSGDKKEETGSTLPIFMSKIDYLRIGGWDENYEQGMVADWDFFLKCQLSGLKMIRTYNCHFYHFASISVNGEKRRQAEIKGHEYARYKWGEYIKSDPVSNLKYL